jgi:hypothetical protein
MNNLSFKGMTSTEVIAELKKIDAKIEKLIKGRMNEA